MKIWQILKSGYILYLTLIVDKKNPLKGFFYKSEKSTSIDQLDLVSIELELNHEFQVLKTLSQITLISLKIFSGWEYLETSNHKR